MFSQCYVRVSQNSTDLGFANVVGPQHISHKVADSQPSNISDDNFNKWADGDDSESEMSESIGGESLVFKKIRVEICSASNLENKDMFGKSDP